jgi:hypothetical protein
LTLLPRARCATCVSLLRRSGTASLTFCRGWAEGSLDGVIEDQRWMEERIDISVERILARFPQPARSHLSHPAPCTRSTPFPARTVCPM